MLASMLLSPRRWPVVGSRSQGSLDMRKKRGLIHHCKGPETAETGGEEPYESLSKNRVCKGNIGQKSGLVTRAL